MKINAPIVVRLALWNTSILLLALSIFGFLSYYFVSKELFNEQQNLLQESGEQISEIMLIRKGRLNTKYLRHESEESLNLNRNGIFFEVTDKRGKTVFRSPNFPYSLKTGINIPANQIRRLPDRNGSAFNVLSISVPIVTRHKNHEKTSLFRIHIGQSVKYVTHILTRIRHLFYWLIPAVLILASLGGWYMAKRSLTPVAKITKTAREINLKNLDTRLPNPKHDDELGRLIITFNEMIDRIQKDVNKIKQFTADASHELRTPLTIMRGEIEVTLRRTRTNKKYKEKLKDILSEILWMSKIVDDLLTLSRSEAGENNLELKSTKPDDIVKEVIESFMQIAQRKNITIKYRSQKGLKKILMDRDRIRQVISNLLDNAVKYTGEHGKVDVALYKKEGGVEITITDTGIGISKEDIPHVFDRFYRADKSRTSYGKSTGLGLAICKWAVEAHNGTISIHSKPGKGTAVKIFLPEKAGVTLS